MGIRDKYINCFYAIRKKNRMNEERPCSGRVGADFDASGCNECPFYLKNKKQEANKMIEIKESTKNTNSYDYHTCVDGIANLSNYSCKGRGLPACETCPYYTPRMKIDQKKLDETKKNNKTEEEKNNEVPRYDPNLLQNMGKLEILDNTLAGIKSKIADTKIALMINDQKTYKQSCDEITVALKELTGLANSL